MQEQACPLSNVFQTENSEPVVMPVTREGVDTKPIRQREKLEGIVIFVVFLFSISIFFVNPSLKKNIVCFLAYCFPPGSPLGGDREEEMNF